MKTFFKVLNKAIETIELILGSAMILCVIIEILSRYLLPFSTTWCEEAARYCLVWGMMLGCAYGFGNHGHIVIDILTNYLGSKGKFWCEIFANLATLIFCAIFLVLSIERFPSIAREYMVMVRQSLGYIYVAIPIGFGLSILYSVKSLADVINGRVKKQ